MRGERCAANDGAAQAGTRVSPETSSQRRIFVGKFAASHFAGALLEESDFFGFR
jgi:hypothetical protein